MFSPTQHDQFLAQGLEPEVDQASSHVSNTIRRSYGKLAPGSMWSDWCHARLTARWVVMPEAPGTRRPPGWRIMFEGMSYARHQAATHTAACSSVVSRSSHCSRLQAARPTISMCNPVSLSGGAPAQITSSGTHRKMPSSPTTSWVDPPASGDWK